MRLWLLRLGTIRDIDGPVPAYLLRLDDGRHILIDTGLPRDLVDQTEGPFAVEPEQHIVAALARLGLQPADIETVVTTHLDPDHAGAHDEFPHAHHVIQRTELAAARSSGALRYQWQRQHWDDPRLHYIEVDGDHQLAPTITLLASPGHSPGHQSVLLDLPETGPVLLAGDAIPSSEQTDPDAHSLTPFDHDESAIRDSTRRLMRIAAERRVRLVVHSHDGPQWQHLRTAPDFYQ